MGKFWEGFEKQAVSESWATKLMAGGLATRAGFRRGSPVHKTVSENAAKYLGSKASIPRGIGLVDDLSKINVSTKRNPREAGRLLSRAAENTSLAIGRLLGAK